MTHTIDAVSVVVCNYNGEHHLVPCLEAIAALEGPVAEVVLVDNESTDGSLELVRTRFPDVRVVSTGHNGGPAPARNVGLREARHPWVLAVDNDAVLEADVLVKLIEAAGSREDVALVQPRSVFADDPGRVHYDGGAFHYAGLIALRNFYRPLADAGVPEGRGVVEVDCAVSVALLCDRDLLLEFGGYDESFFILFEDLDLSYRLRLAGKRILSVEDALCHHRGGTAGISFREGPRYPRSRVFYHSRNRWLYLGKCYSAWTLVVALPGLCVYEAFWFGFALLGGNLGGWIRGKLAFFGLLGELRGKRRAAQARRTCRDRELLVAGPITVTPDVACSAPKRLLLGLLNALLGTWWRLVRGLSA